MLTSIRISGATAACAVALAMAAVPAPAQTASQTGYDETGVLAQTPAPPDQGVLGEIVSSDPGSGIPFERASDDPRDRVLGERKSGGPDVLNGRMSGDPRLLGEKARSPRSGAAGTGSGGDPAGLVTTRLGSGNGASTLPFTGLDVIVVALLGLLLVGFGAVARTVARAR